MGCGNSQENKVDKPLKRMEIEEAVKSPEDP
jgi:hypothetical protein